MRGINDPALPCARTFDASDPTICSAPKIVTSIPTKLIATDIFAYLVSVGMTLLSSTLPDAILFDRRVKFHVQNALMKEMHTPMPLNAKPDDHNCETVSPLRTVLAKVRMTPLMTERTIWNHQETQLVRLTNLLMFDKLVVAVLGGIDAPEVESKALLSSL